MTPILATKLYLPRLRSNVVSRPRLTERLSAGLHRKLTLISAPAGFGKTTLVSAWAEGIERPTAWLSLDEEENDPTRFLTYLVVALQTIAATIGEGVLRALQSPQSPSPEAMLVALLNDLTTLQDPFVLVLDDYHVIDAQPVDQALAYLVEHLPPQMHLVIATREDPHLPLARLRARNHLTEVRATDLQFTHAEAAAFLTQVMGLTLSAENIAALERRTEGWIAGLQLAALSMQGHEDAASFIQSFTGSHHFVLDYLVEEVLGQQPEAIQTFLLRTSFLDRFCGSLCDAVVLDSAAPGQATLEYLERANLFIIPLDQERQWYRYHHLFAELLQLRLHQRGVASPEQEVREIAELQQRASQWYEDHDLLMEAFKYAVAANDVDRAIRLIEGKGIPLHFRGAMVPVLSWLSSLPATVLNARPSLWVTYASALTMTGQPAWSVEEKLQAAETILQEAELDDKARDLIGQIAAIRAMTAIPQKEPETLLTQSRRALEYSHPDNLPVRASATWTLGLGYQFQRDHARASQAYTEVLATAQLSGNLMLAVGATTCLGQVQEAENQLALAAESYRLGLQLAGDPALPATCEMHLGLARVLYEWNELDKAWQHGQESLQLARQLITVDTPAICELFLARLKLAQGDVADAASLAEDASQFVRRQNFVPQMSEVATVQVLIFLRQGKLVAAARVAQTHDLPISQARVFLAQGNSSAALEALSRRSRQVEGQGWENERLKVKVLQAVALEAHGEKKQAVHLLVDALTTAEPAGFLRLFIDEGAPMARLLSEVEALGVLPGYVEKLLAIGKTEESKSDNHLSPAPSQPLIEPLSARELEVLRLMGIGLSNQEMSERLFITLATVKGHNQKIFGKLQVQRRTEAIARARELGLL